MHKKPTGSDKALVLAIVAVCFLVVQFAMFNVLGVVLTRHLILHNIPQAVAAVLAFAKDPLDPAKHWPTPLSGLIAWPLVLWIPWALTATVLYLGARELERHFDVSLGGFFSANSAEHAKWAEPKDITPLVVNRPTPGRLTLGRYRGRLLATEPGQSIAVIGPTQSGKSSGFAIPAMLEWRGPLVATSVKRDLVDVTRAARERYGQVWIYDPGAPDCCTWNPLEQVGDSWKEAQRLADWLIRSADATPGKGGDGNFWAQAATKFLAPLLYAAAFQGGGLPLMLAWLERREWDAVKQALLVAQQELHGATEEGELPLNAWLSSIHHDERFVSSVVATIEAALVAIGDPNVLARANGRGFTARQLLSGPNTLYVCAPLQEQERLRPLFTALVRSVFTAAYDQYSATGKRLEHPLLAVLDEAGNIAPIPDLARIASTGAGIGVQVVSIWHDISQLEKTYGDQGAETVLNNHRGRLILPGISDEKTLLWAERVLGQTEVWRRSRDKKEGRTSEAEQTQALAPAHLVRELKQDTGLLVYGRLRPVRIKLRPWYREPALQKLQRGEVPMRRRKVAEARA